MAAKVFISCGQAGTEEQDMARQIHDWFRDEGGYNPYVATQVPLIPEINTKILAELRSSDYYLFINVQREEVIPRDPPHKPFRRGSVYTNQELAAAVALGIDQMILLNQKGVTAEGILSYMVVNTKEFTTLGDVLDIVKDAVKTSKWTNTFSRHLTVEGDVQLDGPVPYRDHTTGPRGQPYRIAHLKIRNNRPDIAAMNCAARLVEIQPPTGMVDEGRLKAMLRHGYDQSIWPNSAGAFDLFGIHDVHYPMTFLLSETDVSRRPIIQTLGTYTLTYEIFATGFPKLTVKVELYLPNRPAVPTSKIIDVSAL